ncbi:MAG: class I mannose-6-phosphate isomerase [Burkholderiales bacterium]|nr:class I mannose-6-phosphate isomerase [Burkholderiales bacterium]
MQLFFLNPVFKERIWGGTKLYDNFNFPIPSMHTGECWAISAHKNGETTLKNGEFAGYPLSQIWREQPQLFGNDKAVGEFPLLIKILDANADLSVQVHPDDIYARKMENDRGKNECWYILDAKPDAKIIYGHKAASIDNFKQLALSGKWTELLTTLTVKPGDFFDVPTGTVHAIGSGILILEVQQSSDTTYRLYDYDR